MQSTYFNPSGSETLLDVFHDLGDPFPPTSIYSHMQRHQTRDLIRAEKAYRKPTVPVQAMTYIDRPADGSEHEAGLEEFIHKGREKLLQDDMNITPTTYLQAIKIKQDTISKNKDRNKDFMWAFAFRGMGESGK